MPSHSIERIGFCQFDSGALLVPAQLAEIEHLTASFRRALIVLPERMNSSNPPCRPGEERERAEVIPDGPTTQALIRLAQRNDCYFVAGLVERDGDAVFSSAVMLGPEGYVGHHRKVAPPFTERHRYHYGEHARIWRIDGLNLALPICWDLSSDDLIRSLVDQGADILCSCCEFCGEDMQALFQKQAQNFGVPIIGANRCGRLHPSVELEFPGQSTVVDASGRVLLQADAGPAAQCVDRASLGL